MQKNKKRIGFLSYWGRGRGLAYTTLCYAKMIQDEYDVYIFKQGKNPIAEEFKKVKANVFEYPDYIVDRKVFEKWLVENKIDACIFNEYKQWNEDPNELLQLCKELGVRTYGQLVLEKFQRNQPDEYDRVMVRSVTGERFMRMNKVRNFTYTPYSVDLNEFPEVIQREPHDKFVFFHPGGYGGVHDRKNTAAVIDAFVKLDNDDTKLVITSQKKLDIEAPKNVEIIDKDLTRKELIDLYYKADATVLPSKWESIGLPILESLAAGTPVITTDAPPMNEFIRPNLNGYLCGVTMSKYPDISVHSADVDVADMTNKMKMMLVPMMYTIVRKNSRYTVEQLYDLEQNKHYLLDFLKEDLK